MLDKIAGFIVDARKPILVVALLLCAACAAAIPTVRINADMTKYLPDDSEMRAGKDLLERELPDVEMDKSIRVMFSGIDEARSRQIEDKLESLEYAKGVSFDWDDEDYRRDPYALFIVSTEYDYESAEEVALERSIIDAFPGEDVQVVNDNANGAELALWVLVAAVSLLFVILFVMTPSWTEPVLFMITIGIAIVYNLGTNIFFDSVAQTTFSIAAVLQLTLSMDYSIILMSRYRQEKERCPEPVEAMKRALARAFPSIASSGTTTFVGLTMLVFMSFKIGLDLGRVLAKGVLFSMLCVFVILPGLILLANRAIERTGKATPHIPTAGIAKVSYRFRTPIAILFVCLFAGAYYLHTLTPIVFTAEGYDAIAEVFPRNNTMVMLYPTASEDRAAALVKGLEDDGSVKEVSAYSNTLAKQRVVSDMEDAIDDAADSPTSSQLNTTMLKLLYYHAHKDGITPEVTPADFIRFLGTDVLNEKDFADDLDAEAREGIEDMQRFASPGDLTGALDARQLAGFFEMEEGDVRELLAYYFSLHGGADATTLSLSDFSDFMNNEVLKNDRYASRIDADQRKDIEKMGDYTDPEQMTRSRSAKDMSSFLDIDKEDCELLYLYYQVNELGYTPKDMTMRQFATFMNDEVLKNDRFASEIDEDQKDEMSQLVKFTDIGNIESSADAKTLANYFDMGKQEVTQVLLAKYFPDVADTVESAARSAAEEAAQAEGAAIKAQAEAAAEEAATQEAAKAQAEVEKGAKAASEKAAAKAGAAEAKKQGATPESIQKAAEEAGQAAAAEYVANAAADIQERAEKAGQAAAAKASANAEERARKAGEEAAAAAQEETLAELMDKAADKTMSPRDFVEFLLSDSTYTDKMSASEVKQLRRLSAIMDAAAKGEKMSPADMSRLLDMDGDRTSLLFAYHDFVKGDTDWTMSVSDALNYLLHGNSEASDKLSDSQRDQLSQACDIVNGAVAGTYYTPEGMADLLGMDLSDMLQMYYLFIEKRGDTSGWRASVADFVGFLADDVLGNEDYADEIDADQADDVRTARKLVDAVVAEAPISAEGMAELLEGSSEDMDANEVYVLYLLYGGLHDFDPAWTMSIEELFSHLRDDVLKDARFNDLIDDESRADIDESSADLEEARNKLRAPNYSLASINLTLPNESDATEAFMNGLRAKAADAFGPDYYLIGDTPMVYEMKYGFGGEMLLLTLLTATSIFLVVLVSFRRLAVPLILVLLVQCGVYVTIAASGLLGYSMFYQAMLVVQCILMGATIDYGILFANYYREAREEAGRKDSLISAYAGSIHTVLTSGLIMILVTGVIGFSGADPTVCQICQTISIGALSAVLLILLVLPGLLASFDRFVCRKRSNVADDPMPPDGLAADAVLPDAAA